MECGDALFGVCRVCYFVTGVIAMSDAITEKVLDLIASVKKLSREKLSVDSTFEELAMDSLDAINLMFEIENAFNISVPDEDAKSIKNVRQLIEQLEKILAKTSSSATGGKA